MPEFKSFFNPTLEFFYDGHTHTKKEVSVFNVKYSTKRYKKGNNVTGEALRSFSGVLDTKKSNKGVFITTSDFMASARKHVKESSKNIALINGDKLTELMIKFNVGVSIKDTYEVKELDIDYFEN